MIDRGTEKEREQVKVCVREIYGGRKKGRESESKQETERERERERERSSE